MERQIGRTGLNETLKNTGFIAIVDDDEPLREALGSVLKAAGFSIDAFASGEDFLSFPRWRETACLILDVRLPGIAVLNCNADCSMPPARFQSFS